MDGCEVAGPSDWKKRQEAIDRKIAFIAKDSKSDIAGGIAKRKNAEASNDVNCSVISQLCYEAQDQLRSGKMSLKEVVEDLCEALESMEGMKDDEKKEKGE